MPARTAHGKPLPECVQRPCTGAVLRVSIYAACRSLDILFRRRLSMLVCTSPRPRRRYVAQQLLRLFVKISGAIGQRSSTRGASCPGCGCRKEGKKGGSVGTSRVSCLYSRSVSTLWECSFSQVSVCFDLGARALNDMSWTEECLMTRRVVDFSPLVRVLPSPSCEFDCGANF